MSDYFRGVVRELNAVHYGHFSSLPSRRGNRTRYPAKTSLWAKAEMEGGRVVEVWVTKVEGKAGVPTKTQEQQLEAKYADLIGTTILFSQGRSMTCFYEGRADTTSLATNPDHS